MSKELNKEFVSKAQELLQAKGYEVKTSHLYDVFAQLAGYKNWHTASAKNAKLSETIKKYIVENPQTASPVGFLDYIKDTFITMDHQEEKFEIFNPHLPAWNYLVSGQIGSGKAALVKKIIYSALKQYEEHLIIFLDYDENKEYSDFIQLNGGKIIDIATQLPRINFFDLNPKKSVPLDFKIKEIAKHLIEKNPVTRSESELCILIKECFYYLSSYYEYNPHRQYQIIRDYFKQEEFPNLNDSLELFNLKVGECRPRDNQMFVILGCLNIILKDDKQKDLEGFNQNEMEDVIVQLYSQIGQKENRIPTLSDLLNLMIKENWDNKIIDRLKSWTKTGEYPMFDFNTNLKISHHLNLINLAGLESQPRLKQVYHLLINNLVLEKTKDTKNKMKLVVRNEIDFCNEYDRSYFIEHLRTARPQGLATITIKDSPLYFYELPKDEARAILSNMQVNIFCRFQTPELRSAIAKEYGFNEEENESIKNLGIRKENGKYFNYFLMKNYNDCKLYKNFLSDKELEYYP